MKKYLLFLFVVVAITSRAQVYSCNQMQPFCTSNVYTYQAGYDPSNPGSGNGPQASTISPGNNYGCLTTQPNPVWYYLEIDQPGNLNITLSNINSSGVGVDIDFSQYFEEEIDCQKFAHIISENIMRVFNLGEQDVGIFAMYKRDKAKEELENGGS